MAPSFAPWQIDLARIEGALPFVPDRVARVLAMRALRRMWAVHVRDYPFDTIGLEHNPGLEAGELMRSWYIDQRRDFLSWVSRRGPPPLARAARSAIAAKGLTERWTEAYVDAGTALDRLDSLLPSHDPVATLTEWIRQLRVEEVPFLEGGTEIGLFKGHAFDRPAPKGAAWAASLAAAVRPQLFALGPAPFGLAGLMPREVLRAAPERSATTILAESIGTAVKHVRADLKAAHHGTAIGAKRLASRYASSRASDAWELLLGLGPLTRAELARGLGVTPRTASQAAAALQSAKLVQARSGDGALVVDGDALDAKA